MKMVFIVLGALVILAAIAVGVTYKLFMNTVRRQRAPSPPIYEKDFFNKDPLVSCHRDEVIETETWWLERNPERCEITSYDGLRLVARFLRAEGDGKANVILIHGFQSHPTSEFSCVFKFYHDLGFNILLPDMRACGESEGEFVTFGVRERYDVRDWARFLEGKTSPDIPTVLDGVSMGCATALMATGLDLPKSVRLVIADCGFTSPYEIMAHVMKTYMHLPPRPLLAIANVFAKRVAGFDLREYSTVEALKTNKIPVFFAHGEEDNFVPTRMSRENYVAATCEKRILTVPRAGHGTGFLVDRESYLKNMRELFEKHVGIQME